MDHGSEGRAVHFLAQFGLDPPAFRGAHSVDKKDAVEMIVLVLNGPSKEAVGLKLQNLLRPSD